MAQMMNAVHCSDQKQASNEALALRAQFNKEARRMATAWQSPADEVANSWPLKMLGTDWVTKLNGAEAHKEWVSLHLAGVIQQMVEELLLYLVEEAECSFAEMGAAFRRLQGQILHSKLGGDVKSIIANAIKKYGMAGTSQSRKAWKRLCTLRKEAWGA